MTETLVGLLPFVLPPLVGAVIGYVTNALAIRMLFRPLTEKRLFGIRIPLTPGIIPRQRTQLAHSIAQMVSTKLLTEDLLLSRLHDPEFVEVLERSVSGFTSDVLDGRPDSADRGSADARAAGAEQNDASVESARDGVAEVAQSLLASFFRSDAFVEVIHRIAEAAAHGALAMRAERVVPESRRLAELVDGAIVSLAEGPAAPAAERAVQNWVAGHMEDDTPLVEIIGEGSIERLAGIVPGIYEPVLDSLIAFLRQPDTRRELALHGRDLLSRVLKRLNLFQRFIVSATQYDRNLSENMAAVVTDLIDSVDRAGRKPENRDRVVETLQAEVRELGRTGVQTLIDRFGLHAERLVARIFTVAVELLQREDVRRRVADGLNRFVDQHRSEELGQIVGALFGLESSEVANRIVAVVDSWIAQEANADRISARVVEFAVRFFGSGQRGPLRALLPLSDEQKSRIDRFLTVRLQELVERRVPQIIAGLDVYTMVVDKINGLDMESVEELLLMVIARHLKWINLFGALLGSVIGGAQVVIGLVT